jgi:hypothetical protein
MVSVVAARVLLVRVSVVVRPTRVSVTIGRVRVGVPSAPTGTESLTAPEVALANDIDPTLAPA